MALMEINISTCLLNSWHGSGSCKREQPHLSEHQVLIRALLDSTIPKLLTEDAKLLTAILEDLFPGTQQLPGNCEQLQLATQAACAELGLQPVPTFVLKVCSIAPAQSAELGL
jgi:dynein heavy chain, axonemal